MNEKLVRRRRISVVLGVTPDKIPHGGVRTTSCVGGRPVKTAQLRPISASHVPALHNACVTSESVVFGVVTDGVPTSGVQGRPVNTGRLLPILLGHGPNRPL